MSEFKLTSVEEFEQATNELLETGAKVGADAWQFRVKNQTPHCKFGEQGTCCRICTMGPCRITPKAPRGICGCDVHGIVGRNFLRFTAGGSQHIPIMAVRSATHCMRLTKRKLQSKRSGETDPYCKRVGRRDRRKRYL